MKAITQLLALSCGILAISSSVHASDAIGPGDNDSIWILGAGIGSGSNIYAGEDSESFLTPRISYNGERFFVKNGAFSYSAFQRNNLSGGLTVRKDGNFLDDASEYRSNEILAGLIERDSTTEGGFYLNHTTDLGRLNFTVLTDLGNEHDGESASLRYTFDLTAGDWNINPFVGVNWQSANKVNYLFGVSAAEANAFRSAYDADSAINAATGIRARYDITNHWDINLEAGVSYLDSSIKDSSIVDDDKGYYGAISFNYNF